jgi:hypothetical protein
MADALSWISDHPTTSMPETKAILIVDIPVELHQFSALVNATVDASATIDAMRDRS